MPLNWFNPPPAPKAPDPPPPVKTADPRDEMIKWFAFLHLRQELQSVSSQFADVAFWMLHHLPPGPEATMAMRKLLEAKDCAVRAACGKFEVAEAPVKVPVHGLGIDEK